jgi:hypothetical protein
VDAQCDPSEVVVGGGFNLPQFGTAVITSVWYQNGWAIQVRRDSTTTTGTFTVYAYCTPAA